MPGCLDTIREYRPISEKTEKYVKTIYIIGINIDDMAFQLHILGLTNINYYNYIFNVLVNHELLLIDNSIITSESPTSTITPTDFGNSNGGEEKEESYILDDEFDDLDNIEEYNNTV